MFAHDTTLGIIVVDHGSRLAEANDLLIEVARALEQQSGAAIVEPAHMELAEPRLDQAFAACVRRGARRVIVHPYFLAPGRHSTLDIPRIVAEAAANHPGVTYSITDPLGSDPRIVEVIQRRIAEALAPEASCT